MEAAAIEQPVTAMTYLGDIAAMSWRHGSELAATVACAIAIAVVALVAFPARALFVLPPAIAAVLLLEAAAAAWRLHRRQHIALATTRSLLDLNAAGRRDLEWRLASRYRRREARIQERNAVRQERMEAQINALQREVAEHSHQEIAM